LRLRNQQLARDLAEGRTVGLDLGSGGHARHDLYSVDVRDLPGVDLVGDLNEPLDVLPDGSVHLVLARHVLEHVRDLDALMSELHRVLTPDGTLEVTVPHAMHPLTWSDPTHVRGFALYSFAYFVPPTLQPFQRKVPCYRARARFELRSVRLRFTSRRGLRRVVEPLVNRSFATQEWFERWMATVVPPDEVHAVLHPCAEPT
jgi:SAM-dependent methyltransferase